jgi:two-component system chemotaxis response regulator CheB
MGRDGCNGAKTLKRGGATIWAQDEESSLIYGMPQAVAKSGMADKILGLDAIANDLASGT